LHEGQQKFASAMAGCHGPISGGITYRYWDYLTLIFAVTKKLTAVGLPLHLTAALTLTTVSICAFGLNGVIDHPGTLVPTTAAASTVAHFTGRLEAARRRQHDAKGMFVIGFRLCGREARRC
jgi:hypothetical protein